MGLIIKKIKAFTLAEVLITLGIIGVVAALTIPALLNSTNDLQLKSAFKKDYSVISQAYTSLLQDSGGSLKGKYNTYSDEFINDFKNKFQISKYCPSPARGTCWHNNNVAKNLNGGDDWTTFWASPIGGMILNDGSLVAISYYAKDCDDSESCGFILVDANGFKKPNIQGKDIFSLYINENTIPPGGSPHTYVYGLTNHGCSATDAGSDGHAGLGCSADVLMGHDY